MGEAATSRSGRRSPAPSWRARTSWSTRTTAPAITSPPNSSGLRLTIFNAFPSTVTFVGVIHDEVIATVSVIPDTPVGLPMDEIYHDEVQALRDAGRRLMEVTMLADRRLSVSRSLAMVLALMKLVFDYATLSLKATDLCITVNPHHDKFYHEYLLFTPLGGLRAYPSVSGNPAIARRLDLVRVEEECQGRPVLLHRFFEDRTPLGLFEKRYHMAGRRPALLLRGTDADLPRVARLHAEPASGVLPGLQLERAGGRAVQRRAKRVGRFLRASRRPGLPESPAARPSRLPRHSGPGPSPTKNPARARC